MQDGDGSIFRTTMCRSAFLRFSCWLPGGANSAAFASHAISKNYMDKLSPLIAVVDDDESVRESLPDLLKEPGFTSKTFASAFDFLSSSCVDTTTPLISDVAMPGMSGPELHAELHARGCDIPTIFITAHEIILSRKEVVVGALTCLVKPFSDNALSAALTRALTGKQQH